MKRRKGHQVEYQGKKYDSLSELSKDLELPYSSIVHNYYRTKNVDKAVKIAQKAKEAEIYVVWGKKYCISAFIHLLMNKIYVLLDQNFKACS